MQEFISVKDVVFDYTRPERPPVRAVDHVDLVVESGRHVAVLGRNGSGKSTLARLVNALELPLEGTVVVAGFDSRADGSAWEIRQRCGMVFQNPDNQIVGTTVEEDVAFGPENLGVPQPMIRLAVDEALAVVGLSEYAVRPPHLLSGGQKQKLAIAGILAMKPRCILLDEATSMLDPVSRRDFMEMVIDLVRREGITLVNITHHMEEAVLADEVVVLAEGRIVARGTPSDVFEAVEAIRSEGLDVPAHMEIAHRVSLQLGVPLLHGETATPTDAVEAVRRVLHRATFRAVYAAETGTRTSPPVAALPAVPLQAPSVLIDVQHLDFTYLKGTPFANRALHDVSFQVFKGEILGLIGHSGSGKSTLVQHLNGLLRSTAGTVRVMGLDASRGGDIRAIRQKVGLLFQYPEHQLFEETIYADIAFGPKRMGLSDEEVDVRVLEAAAVVGIAETDLQRSPFELSGGQKRRAAIAGILSMRPEVLILDEPAAGLDPVGRDEILSYAASLRKHGATLVLVSHSMEDIARLSDRVLVLDHGSVLACGDTRSIFTDEPMLAKAGLSLPASSEFLKRMAVHLPGLDTGRFTSAAAADAVVEAYRASLAGEGPTC
jgi:energy-coupling factor transporter ATPase